LKNYEIRKPTEFSFQVLKETGNGGDLSVDVKKGDGFHLIHFQGLKWTNLFRT